MDTKKAGLNKDLYIDDDAEEDGPNPAENFEAID